MTSRQWPVSSVESTGLASIQYGYSCTPCLICRLFRLSTNSASPLYKCPKTPHHCPDCFLFFLFSRCRPNFVKSPCMLRRNYNASFSPRRCRALWDMTRMTGQVFLAIAFGIPSPQSSTGLITLETKTVSSHLTPPTGLRKLSLSVPFATRQ